MTLTECRNNTALLGFSESLTELDDIAENAFRAAINRAIWEVDALRPRLGVVILSHYPKVNHVRRTAFYHNAGSSDTICATGDAYTFQVSGSGRCVVSNGFRRIEHVWSGESQMRRFSGFLSGVLELTFLGDSCYPVKGIGVFDKEGMQEESDIPTVEPYVLYDLSALAPDALAVATPPEKLVGGHYQPMEEGYRITNSRYIELPCGEVGEYRITYRRLPPQVEQDTDYETPIGLDEDLCQLLPLQIAYYLLLDDDPAAAQAYLTQFREGAYRIGAKERVRGVALCKSVNGW